MVHTEVDMIVNHINHNHIDYYHIIHHQGIIYNFLNLLNFSIKRNYKVSSITTMIIMEMHGCSMIDKGGSLILTLVREADFRTLIRATGFSNSIPYFDGSFDVESTLLWIDKIDGLFDMEYIPMKDQVEFVSYKLKGRAAA